MSRAKQAAEEISADIAVNRYLSVAEVARHYRISRQALYKELQKLGTAARFCELQAAAELAEITKRRAEVLNMYADGVCVEDIAAHLDQIPFRVRQWLRLQGITRRNNQHNSLSIYLKGERI